MGIAYVSITPGFNPGFTISATMPTSRCLLGDRTARRHPCGGKRSWSEAKEEADWGEDFPQVGRLFLLFQLLHLHLP